MDVTRMPESAATGGPSRQELLRIYEQEYRGRGSLRRRAKTAQVIPEYLQSQGYRIIPVNPKGGEILGERVYFCREGGPIEVLMRYGVATLTTEKGRE